MNFITYLIITTMISAFSWLYFLLAIGKKENLQDEVVGLILVLAFLSPLYGWFLWPGMLWLVWKVWRNDA